jgi:hypothetical protein
MIDPNNFILHFGCRGKAGHHLTRPNRQEVRDFEAEKLGIPKASGYDCNPAFLPYPEKVGSGCLTYLPANHRTILAWWDRTYDARGRCNMAVIASGCWIADGDDPAGLLWAAFVQAFPDLAGLKKPDLVRADLRVTKRSAIPSKPEQMG